MMLWIEEVCASVHFISTCSFYQHRLILVHTGSFWCTLVNFGWHWFIFLWTGTFWFALLNFFRTGWSFSFAPVHFGSHQVHFGPHRLILVRNCSFLFQPVYFGQHQHILICVVLVCKRNKYWELMLLLVFTMFTYVILQGSECIQLRPIHQHIDYGQQL